MRRANRASAVVHGVKTTTEPTTEIMSTTHDADDPDETTTATLHNSSQTFIRGRPNVAADLPPPSETWRLTDRTFDEWMLRQLKHQNIIKKVEKCYEWSGVDTRSTYWTWRTTEPAWNYIDEFDDATECPKGNYTTGFSNVRGEDGYTCDTDECDCRFGRDLVKEILN